MGRRPKASRVHRTWRHASSFCGLLATSAKYIDARRNKSRGVGVTGLLARFELDHVFPAAILMSQELWCKL